MAETEKRTLLSEIEQLTIDRDEAQSLVEAWASAVETLEAHLQDRVTMCDEAKPETYLSILRHSVAEVSQFSKQVRNARWADYRRNRDEIEILRQSLDARDEALGLIAQLDSDGLSMFTPQAMQSIARKALMGANKK